MEEAFEVPQADNGTTYLPDPEYRRNARIPDYTEAVEEYRQDPERFWERIARELEWFAPWSKVLQWEYPYARWFDGAKLNITHNCLDRHVLGERKNRVALIWRGEQGEERIFSYHTLLRAVQRCANALRSVGVRKGERVCIYMPLVPEQLIVMLACARIGAVHSVVFGGFGAGALGTRIADAGAKVLVTADIARRRGKVIDLLSIAREAVATHGNVGHVLVLRRDPASFPLTGKELDYAAVQAECSPYCPPEVMDAEDPLFVLYTSGSTGTPKGVVHTCGGYMTGTYYTTKVVFDLKETDIYWCTADPGWITGHSYIVYGPLCAGATVFMTEITPDYPDPGSWWQLIAEQGITVFYTAPTAIRMFMRMGDEWPRRHDLSSLRVLGSVGEPLNPEAFEWYRTVIGGERCPIVDTWWQTETGMQMIATLIGEPMKPGFAGPALPGVKADVVDRNGTPVPPGTGGSLVICEPWPAMFRTILNNDERYRMYWSTIPGMYLAGDLAVKDRNGYIMILGRSDDMIKVAGHLIGTAEVESALVSHHAVAEAAVIGVPDPIRGNRIKAFVILRRGNTPSEDLAAELITHVRRDMGPVGAPAAIEFKDRLPKTRSGKIMRRVLKAQEMGIDPGDISTLEE